ncbi:hypothetical protein E3N88_44534 [Mikania micrantha]|uniref:Retrotransposon Copia-like N-terminal domain-containing protein n=1 Tax=Mikania micrantha TaxID=192012 RepID=A0A5N6LBR2_9ASTR|nr:hypothetical protein E3N88_44534 [Mikania micrantha]
MLSSFSPSPCLPPLILMNSRSTLMHMMNIKLGSSNYLLWANQMKPILTYQNLYSYVDDSSVSPPAMISTDVKQFVKECDVWQRCKASTVMPGGLLQPLDIPEAIWEDLSKDFIGGLPLSIGVNVILIVADRLSKYVHFIALKHPYTAKGVAELFVKGVMVTMAFQKQLQLDCEARSTG